MSLPWFKIIDSDDSDDGVYDRLLVEYAEQQEAESSRGPPWFRRYIHRDHIGTHQRLMEDYFGEDPKYPPSLFQRRFRMRRERFLRFVEGIISYSVEPIPAWFEYFRQKPDARGHEGLITIQKYASAIKQLAFGITPDANDEYLQMGETTTRESLDAFCKCVFKLYAAEYLRKPTPQDIQRLYAKHEECHGFPGMLGSIDCMHWHWKNCSKGWAGQYTRGDHGHPTVMLEAVASYDLWIWHAYFGTPGSNNDINVLNQSDV